MIRKKIQIAFLPLSLVVAYLTPFSIIIALGMFFRLLEKDGYMQKAYMNPFLREVFFYTFSFLLLVVVPFVFGFGVLSFISWLLTTFRKTWQLERWTKVIITVLGMAIYFLFLENQFPFTFSPD